ncbi:LOW QUALITY PROTEIN: fatty acyl-CoA reductase 6, chloroplastic-like [Herrania umbratica]|uniref:Fatty acyl-CoA reductase n=1 Tax=Herrania umbratica TaxID=108875 RepID=A0A6J1BQA3_9ROSI|nr:LOW QUALITY PROTEIN: fatty acyl-CoA reductase 6, chloroplastic-like [Herrania umbratica]
MYSFQSSLWTLSSPAIPSGCTVANSLHPKTHISPLFISSCQNSRNIKSALAIRAAGKNVDHDDAISTTTNSTTVPLMESSDGLGIVDFLQGKNYFITGATGFVGKAFVEKMLRAVPNVGKIFLLIKGKDKEAATRRLHDQIMDTELFKSLEQVHGTSYKTFMKSKLVPVVGNVNEPDLGMDADMASEIANEVDIIVNSAANTTFDDRYDATLNTNTMGPYRLLGFAKKCKKLSLFLHFSTAYVHGKREGIILERPLCEGQSVAEAEESIPVLDIKAEIKLASNLKRSFSGTEIPCNQKMKELGMERARAFGWQNTYSFTKAMGEMLINSTRGDIPVVIIRPSIIESTFREPFPGWIEGSRMLDPIIIGHAKGHLTGFIGDPETVIDVVPVDMVVNASMAAMAKQGLTGKPGLTVYHVTSSVANPVDLQTLLKSSSDHFNCFPIKDLKGPKITGTTDIKLFRSVDIFSSYIRGESTVGQNELKGGAASSDPKLRRRQETEYRKIKLYIHLAKLYEPFSHYRGWFDSGNTVKLIRDMSTEERENFGFDVQSIDWEHYFLDIHIPGLRRHVMKEPHNLCFNRTDENS